jgi:hypothetical protein
VLLKNSFVPALALRLSPLRCYAEPSPVGIVMFRCCMHSAFLQVHPTPNLTFNTQTFQAIHTIFLQQVGTKLLRDELDGPHNDKHAT